MLVVLALVVASAAPARARDPHVEDGPLLTSPTFWKASAGAMAGAWVGARALAWGPVLGGLSQNARASYR